MILELMTKLLEKYPIDDDSRRNVVYYDHPTGQLRLGVNIGKIFYQFVLESEKDLDDPEALLAQLEQLLNEPEAQEYVEDDTPLEGELVD